MAYQQTARPAEANGRPRAKSTPHETDVGNALRLIARHGDDLGHIHPWKKWMAWDGTRWRLDDSGEATRRAKDTIANLLREAGTEIARIGGELQQADEDAKLALRLALKRAEKLLAWALKSEQAPRIEALLSLARSERPVLPAQLDTDPMLLNVANGTINLRTGEMRQHRRGDLVTKLCPTPYDPSATCPNFERAVATIFAGDVELIAFVQRWLGYSLTGDVREQAAPIWWGAGANGKTTIINAVLGTIGTDYAGPVPPELLMEARGAQHPTLLASLFGMRLLVASETSEGRSLNEERLKTLTGGDTITARRMREDFWSFKPTHKLILVTNHKPTVTGTDHAIWRRLRLVPFTVRFLDPAAPENLGTVIPQHLHIDRELPELLRRESPGILSWLVRGCLSWQRNGLPCPPVVRAATAEYRAAEDIVETFLSERCLRGGAEYRARASDLYGAFVKWSEASGEKCMSMKKFGNTMTGKGFEKRPNNGIWYLGVALCQKDDTEGWKD